MLQLLDFIKSSTQEDEDFIYNINLYNNILSFKGTDKKGKSALHYAVEKDFSKLLAILLIEIEKHPDEININGQDNEGNTPLHLAVKNRNIAMCWELIEAGADLNFLNNTKFTPIMIAVDQGYSTIIDSFIARKIEINKKGICGYTPLHAAIVAKKDGDECQIIKKLICAGADLNIKDDAGLTPINLAKFYGEGEIVTLLALPKTNLDIVSGEYVLDEMKAMGGHHHIEGDLNL